MKRLWTTHRWLVLAFVATVALAGFFAINAAMHAPKIRFAVDPASQPVQVWMTPRFITHTYDMPPELVGKLLGVVPGSNPRMTLTEIAAEQGVSPDSLRAAMDAGITAFHAAVQE